MRSASIHAVLDVGQTQLGGPAAGGLDHGRREVTRDQAARDGGRLEAGVADARRQLEHRVLRLRPQLGQQPARMAGTFPSTNSRRRSQLGAIASATS